MRKDATQICQHQCDILKQCIESRRYSQFVLNIIALSLNNIKIRPASLPQLERNVFKLHANDPKKMSLFGDGKVVNSMNGRPCQCAKATSMSLHYNHPRRTAFTS